MDNNKLIMGLVVLVLLLGALWFFMTDPITNPMAQNDTVTIPQNTQAVQPSTTSRAGNTVSQAKIYTDLVKEYEGRRIQFDINCQAIPSNVTYKSGVKVMFDNRSGDARVITVGGVKYNFAGYGYKILTLSSPTLPKNILLSCGSAVNVGQILLQK